MYSIPVTILSRDNRKNLRTSNLGYVIAAGTAFDFTRNFPVLMKEPRWNPYAHFLIIVKHLETIDLTSIFNVLLNNHVNNVIVIRGNNDAHIYTYNPFDNYNCGKKYDEIIEFGKCLTARVSDFFPEKLVTGLRNCTFKATTAHWPPYAFDPKISGNSVIGAEQYAMKIISDLEQFKVKYTKSISGEEFSTIADNMSALGNLYMLQEKKADFLFGGMLLLHFRADAFAFLAGHVPFIDDVRIFVKRADIVPYWKNVFLEFKTSVWILLIVTFIGYFVSVAAILRVKDKTTLFLVMIDLFFLHGSKMISKSRGIFILWVFFAYLISTYYQSSLVSIITNPYKNYQISTNEDLIDYKLEPCLSTVIQKYIYVMQNLSSELTYKDNCNGLLESIKSISQSHKKYTICVLSMYLYNKHLFYDEGGEELIYAFKRPLNSIIFSIYLNKGFPLLHKLEMYTIRLRENGLINKYIDQLYETRISKSINLTRATIHHSQVLFPWYILVVGSVVSTGIFLLEIFSKKKPRTM
ncbi:uncharacterized protein [Epargyreus clarus]|uniref:uncharacterized protein n=1 Tax=Epargyreus clarus TaxID=520877 RepID=UPI003C2BE2E1